MDTKDVLDVIKGTEPPLKRQLHVVALIDGEIQKAFWKRRGGKTDSKRVVMGLQGTPDNPSRRLQRIADSLLPTALTKKPSNSFLNTETN